ncbi:MAG: DUF4935 domain-containing protein [Chlorobi bacterium]|nr:DUF4935 domain-containing protein [Chlorobiota bacterium]
MENSIFRITELEEQDLFKKGHVVFDSSALLSFYGYTEKISNEYFTKIFKKLKGRLWLPAQVLYEFEKNRENVIKKPKGEYTKLIESSNSRNEGGNLSSIKNSVSLITKNSDGISGQLKALSEKTKKDNKHPYLKQESINRFREELEKFQSEIELLKKSFERLEDDTQKQITKQIKKIKDKSLKDKLRERIDKFFNQGSQYSYEKMLDIIREGKFRYENEIPPGYKDEDEKIGFQIYGDLILWFQIIDYAKNKNLPIIFVTNDIKEDWWYQEKSKNINETPRHELLYEFKDKTNHNIWFYTTDKFIYKSNLFLNTGVDDKVIEEVKIANKHKYRQIELEWLELLQEALDNGEDVKANHRYKYKEKSLGTWLTGVSQANKNGKKFKLRQEIEDVGFDYNDKGRSPEALTKRFIKQLIFDELPNKVRYQNWFNSVIAPKKNSLSSETVKELNHVWNLKFNEERHWDIPARIKDRTDEWKEYRYDPIINPKNKWSTNDKEMGDLYFWVLSRKKKAEFLEIIIDQFNETEIIELRNEGFPVDEIQ